MLASTLTLDVHVTTTLGVTTGTIMALIQKAEKFIQQIPRSTYSFSGVFSRNIHFVMISCFDKIVMKDRYKLFKEIATVVYRLLERLKDSR